MTQKKQDLIVNVHQDIFMQGEIVEKIVKKLSKHLHVYSLTLKRNIISCISASTTKSQNILSNIDVKKKNKTISWWKNVKTISSNRSCKFSDTEKKKQDLIAYVQQDGIMWRQCVWQWRIICVWCTHTLPLCTTTYCTQKQDI